MAVTPDSIAESMVDLIQKGEYTGGTVFRHDMGAAEVEYEGKRVEEELLGPDGPRLVGESLAKERGGRNKL